MKTYGCLKTYFEVYSSCKPTTEYACFNTFKTTPYLHCYNLITQDTDNVLYKIPMGSLEAVNRRRINNTMTKNKQ